MRFTEDTLSRVRDENPIEEVIADFLDIKKSGKNYKALCPFHAEKTPSLFVSPQRGIYHCFGCGKTGNVITFLIEYKGMTFPEAVRFLAERAGIEIKGEEEKNVDILKVLEYASQLYQDTLLKKPQGKPGLAYFERRGIKNETIIAFKLGYAPTSQRYILEIARKKGMKKELLEKAGLVVEGRDKFIKRIMFPVFNTAGKVVGFGSRVIDERQPKYMNSPDTDVYKKSNTLYGLHQTKGDIRKEKLAILVEGNLDLLSLWQAGVKNVIASLGTSLTDGKESLLSRYAKNVVVFYDSDDAGLKATRRAIDILLKNSLGVRVALSPSGYDPDSLVREKGIDYKNFLRTTVDFLEFVVNVKKTDNPEDRVVLINEVRDMLSLLKDPIRKEVWTDEASKRFGISKSLLVGRSTNTKRKSTFRADYIDAQHRVEAKLLGFALKDKSVWNLVKKAKGVIQTPTIKEIFNEETTDSEEIMGKIEPDLRKIVGDVLFSEREKEEELEETQHLLKKLRSWKLKNDLKSMREIMKQESSQERLKKLIIEYEKMQREAREIN